RLVVTALALLVVAACAPAAAPAGPTPPTAAAPLSPDAVRRDTDVAGQRLAAAADRLPPTAYPVRTGPDGACVTPAATGWTSGFFAGSLRQLYALTHDPAWRARAEAREVGVEPAKTDDSSHAVGF